MDFWVLGPLRVEDSGAERPIGGRKQRTLLALLVASAGVPVSTDSLLMGVYGPDADPKTRRSLQTYVSMLRRELGDSIRRSGDGYVLQADPDSIDAVRFEEALRRARTMVDETIAASLLADGLALWRGQPYADVEPAARLQAEITRLEELRAEALEARFELELLGGRHREVLGDLETAIADYPLRERLRAQQIVALYRSGRQAEALRAHDAAVAYLRENVGLDPTAELRDLERRVIDQDPSLDYRPRPRSRGLPSRYTTFVGRRGEVAAVKQLIDDHRLVTLTGPGGIGKSSIAAEAARSMAKTTKTIYVPVETNRSTPPAALVAESVGVLGDGDDTIGQIALALGDEPTLLLLDGCEDVIDELPDVVDELLSRCPFLSILVTSREGLFIAGEHVVSVGPLPCGPGSPADVLFADRAGFRYEEMTEADREAVTTIGSRVSGHPLALELAAARIRSMSLGDIVDGLDDQVSLLAVKRRANPRHTSVAAALEWSYQALPPTMQRAFRSLGVFRSGVPVDGLAYVLGDTDAVSEVRELHDLSVLGAPDETGRHELLEPIRQYAAMLLDEHSEAEAAQARYAEWTASFWEAATDRFERDFDTAYTQTLRRNGPEAASVASWAVDNDHVGPAVRIIAATARYWERILDPTLLTQPAQRALRHPEASAEARYPVAVARAAFLHRLPDEETGRELLWEAQRLAETLDDDEQRRAVVEILAILPHQLENNRLTEELLTRMLGHYDEFLDLTERAGLPIEPHLMNRALFLSELGDEAAAGNDLQRVVEWAGDDHPVFRSVAQLQQASRHRDRGEFEAAVTLGRDAARILREQHWIWGAIEAERGLAMTEYLAGRPSAALQATERYDAMAQLIGQEPIARFNPDIVACVMSGVGRWDDFAAALRLWLDRAPQDSEPEAWRSFLAGPRHWGSSLVYLMRPTARWARDRGDVMTARRLAASAPTAFTQASFDGWEAIGEVARMEELAAELGEETHAADVEPPDSLEGVMDLIVEYAAG